ncbi:hypothetical protein EOD39_13511 [Acipenser ruthenus]|uniref:Uncharacterized protein n=1 Tax=Acipenser ruthenus TaxID=7906 RepID=A0A444UIG3_ACIRT|nr:hypothetical protein EOD39_13511 [Acipenser ruthenus]
MSLVAAATSQPQCVRSAQDISIRGLFTEGRLSAQKMPNLVKAQLLSQGCWSYQGGKHKKLYVRTDNHSMSEVRGGEMAERRADSGFGSRIRSPGHRIK